MPEPKARPHVALIVETSVVYGREILKGVSRYLAVHGPWSLFLDERELNAPPPDWLLGWSGDGIICRSTNPELAVHFLARQIPVVDLNDRHGDLGLPRIASDMSAIGALAADCLLQRGFQSIAYCGFEGEPWCEGRLAGVRHRVQPCGVLRTPLRGLREHEWQEERDLIVCWLCQLPKPLGIVACNDVRAYHVLDACRLLGLSVPEEVSVVGVDNAETFCTLCDPPLTSVLPDAERIGYEAAALLNRLMRGEQVTPETRIIPPKGVVLRQSTDSVAIADPLVAKAVRYIREHAHRPIGVEDLIPRFQVSRSTFERRFRAAIGHSPHDEIRNVRLKRVKRLLKETDWPIARIAEEAGFEHPEYLMVQFKRATGRTPTQWRTMPSSG